jgi:hypothetical protein
MIEVGLAPIACIVAIGTLAGEVVRWCMTAVTAGTVSETIVTKVSLAPIGRIVAIGTLARKVIRRRNATVATDAIG